MKEVASHTSVRNSHTSACAPFGERCPKHHGLYHYQCAECGTDCTMGTAGGPAENNDGVTRCWKCALAYNQKRARLREAAPELLAALEAAHHQIRHAEYCSAEDGDGHGCSCGATKAIVGADAAIQKAKP